MLNLEDTPIYFHQTAEIGLFSGLRKNLGFWMEVIYMYALITGQINLKMTMICYARKYPSLVNFFHLISIGNIFKF